MSLPRSYARSRPEAIAEGLSDIAHGRTHSRAQVMREAKALLKKS